MVWAVAAPCTVAALATRLFGVAQLPFDPVWASRIALVALATGLAIRVAALRALGPLYSVDVSVRPNHQLVTSGLYRTVRHPAYAGLLLCFLAVGVASWSWIGLPLATVPVTLAFAHRIRIEEKALEERFGQAYRDYRRTSSRLVPGLY